ncbi:MAG: SUMF1/EgtB/PvdO family nonheme iron enzyme [Polyangiaceae bacterium]|nr:SUMF1/EgtB/PvdO family nonheme iron enzyme [Polyangiaceae bacterium]MBK8938338.1 SUMF1/EgtB/PvdO family nonheme iron enzyme [Polyangiaceae bacterium]
MPEAARRWAPWVGGAAVVAAAMTLAGLRSSRVERFCAPGFGAQRTRCCAPGQTEQAGRCVGAATSCPAPLEPGEGGACAPPPSRVSVPLTRLAPGTTDWEAAGQVRRAGAEVPAFVIDAFEVTETRWSGCASEGRCRALELTGEPGRPVVGLTVHDAAAFCAWAGGALPTPHQFEAAAAGAAGNRYPWGQTGAVCRRAAWGRARGPCAQGATGPELGGAFPDGATPLGVHDLAGNVAEWVQTADGSAVEVRGGSFGDEAAAALRSWSSRPAPPAGSAEDVGFRCVYPPEKSNDSLPPPREGVFRSP